LPSGVDGFGETSANTRFSQYSSRAFFAISVVHFLLYQSCIFRQLGSATFPGITSQFKYQQDHIRNLDQETMLSSKRLLSFIAILTVVQSLMVLGADSKEAGEEIDSMKDLVPTGGDHEAKSYKGVVFGPAGKVRIVVKHDRYPRETSWKLSKDSVVIADQKKNTVTVNNKQISRTVTLGAGRYKFSIQDAAADGICCDYGGGYWEIYIDQGWGPTTVLYASDGDFARKEEIAIVLS
jgi:hypothetical protein